MAKSPISKALTRATLKDRFKSSLEERIAAQLDEAGIDYDYEGFSIAYVVPMRKAKYTPDFPCRGGIIIEGKGHFGATNYGQRFSNMKQKSSEQRQKFLFIKEQNPSLDIRFVFQRGSAPIYKGSPTTHAIWAETHGFKWAEKVIPQEWLDEIKRTQE